MGLFIITIAIFSLATLVFQVFWKAVLQAFYYIIQKAPEVSKKIIVAVRRLGRVIMILYRRWASGKITKNESEEVLQPEDVPEGLWEELDIHNEVIVKKGEIDPSEF